MVDLGTRSVTRVGGVKELERLIGDMERRIVALERERDREKVTKYTTANGDFTMQNSWTESSGLEVCIRAQEIGGRTCVDFTGRITGGSSATVAFTLPAAVRPTRNKAFSTALAGATLPDELRIVVQTDGDVQVQWWSVTTGSAPAADLVYLDDVRYWLDT